MRYGDISGTFPGDRRLAPPARRSSHSFLPSPATARDGHHCAGKPITAGDQTDRGTPRHRGGAARLPEPGAATEGQRPGLIHLTYISECCIPEGEIATEIELILADARVRNERHEVTGALLFTGACFVQTLEGSAGSVDGLMTRIARDGRHAALVVIDRHDIDERAFAGWSMSYAGPSRFIARVVAQGLAGFHAGVPTDVARLLKVMVEFGAALPLRPAP